MFLENEDILRDHTLANPKEITLHRIENSAIYLSVICDKDKKDNATTYILANYLFLTPRKVLPESLQKCSCALTLQHIGVLCRVLHIYFKELYR